ncbi:unnamed protein product [Linum trigynum]|uniref:Secreted protein n=1 Tax=Linum trigynum TaxID=586398 RepID=A0AAV2FSY1_9ROSI
MRAAKLSCISCLKLAVPCASCRSKASMRTIRVSIVVGSAGSAAMLFEAMTCSKLASCSASTWTTAMVGVDGCGMLASGTAAVADV